MKNFAKVILISQYPLPYHKIGSWTTMYDNYLKSEDSVIDFIISPQPKLSGYTKVDYIFYKNSFLNKVRSKLTNNRFYHIIKKLSILVNQNSNGKFIIQVIDNYGLLVYLIEYIEKNNLGDRIYVQYFFHGFILDHNLKNLEKVFSSINELVLLTHLSLQYHQQKYNKLPEKISVLYNGINSSLFNRELRSKKDSKTIFLWCSQDRPKKGLHIIMEIWNEFHNNYINTELWIVGTQNLVSGKGIKSFGKINNTKLPKIYSKADVYLFPTQWTEPFGLTLIEALHCGCFCIASNSGGVPEVLNHGEFGWLVDEPDNPKNWKILMEKYLIEKPKTPTIKKELYSLDTWSNELNKIINKAKLRFSD